MSTEMPPPSTTSRFAHSRGHVRSPTRSAAAQNAAHDAESGVTVAVSVGRPSVVPHGVCA
jgi:hypothetical protein